MKRIGSMLVAAVLLAAPLAVFAAGKTHDMMAEVVSVDAKTKMITLKDDKGESHTAPLMGAAIGQAKTLKAGDKVNVTCQDNEKGEHQGVTAIKKS